MSVRAGQPLTRAAFSSIRDHAWQADHRINEDNFKVLTSSNHNSDLLILEALAIHEHRPSLNEYNSGPLLIF